MIYIFLLLSMMEAAVWAVCEIEASPYWTVKVTCPCSHNTKQLGKKPTFKLSRSHKVQVPENRHRGAKGLTVPNFSQGWATGLFQRTFRSDVQFRSLKMNVSFTTFISVQWKWTLRSLRSFPFSTNERLVQCVHFRSVKMNGNERSVHFS